MCRVQTICHAALFLFLISLAAGTQAVVPYEDTGFTPTTPRPDPDLVVVRESAHGATGVDLSAYGIGAGPVDFVQSIYFRFFVDHDEPTVDSFTGRVAFPPGIEILGIIVDGTMLGGAVDDGVATATDLACGVATDPDDYSEDWRGFETGGGPGSSEFVGITSSCTFVYGLNVTNGVDDFRVVIDYGTEFGEDLAFDIDTYDVGALGGAIPSEGIRVGHDANPAVFGSGDFGETGSVHGIPLTSTVPPQSGQGLPFDPLANLFIARDTAVDSYLDGYDAWLDLPAPDLYAFSGNGLGTPVGITDGIDGKLYTIGQQFGLAVAHPGWGISALLTLTDPDGTNVDITSVPSTRDLFIARDTGGDTFVDRLDIVTFTYSAHVAIDQSGLGTPVGIADGADGLLYVLGNATGFAAVNPATAQVTLATLAPPTGTYVDLTGRVGAQALYLLRDTAGESQIDVYDIATGQVNYGFASFSVPGSPVGITDGPGDRLFVIGSGAVGPAGLTVVDPTSGAVLSSHAFMDFAGSNVRITNLEAAVVAVPHSPPVSAQGLRHGASPNPFNATVTISYEMPRADHVRIAVYDLNGRLVDVVRDGPAASGHQRENWDGRDRSGRLQASGVYVYRIEAGSRRGWGRVTLAK